jgi:hypothetical protein
MPFTAEAELTIAAPIDDVFASFIDYRTWKAWMSPVIRPITGPARPLRQGDRLFVLIGNAAPTLLTVDRLEAPREVVWSGGIPGVLSARHSFFFEAVAGGTRILSSEPWSGIVTAPKGVASALHRVAESGGRTQLRHFERWFATLPRAASAA